MASAAHQVEETAFESFADELEPGTKLLFGQFEILSFLNAGGFGITYVAQDSLQRRVVVKECFPSAFCRRSDTLVTARSRQRQDEFQSIVALFLQEALNLSKLNHPNIVKVHQVFQDNETAYMAMDLVEGPDLLDTVDGTAPRLKPDEIILALTKMLDALGYVHAQGFLHRDISPDNILLDRSTGEPVLIDFGAARKDVTRKSRALSGLRVVKDGYSPQEFYIAGSAQGPWSDIYALGATLYHVIAGEAPPNGQARLADLAEGKPDSYAPLAGRFEGYPKGFLEAIDTAMKSLPRERIQSASDWLAYFRTPGVLQIYPERHPAVSARSAASVQESEVVAKVSDVVAPAAAGPATIRTPKPGGANGAVMMVGGLAAVGAVVGIAFVLMGSKDLPVAEAPLVPVTIAAENAEIASIALVDKLAVVVAPEIAVAEVAAPEVAVPEVAVPEVAESPIVVAEETRVPPAVAPEIVVVAEPAASAAPDVAVPDVLASEPVVPKAPVVVPVAEQQITFAAWDVQMPFVSSDRIVGGKQTVVISRATPGVDLSVAGDWVRPGITILAVNDTPIQSGATVAGSVLNALKVDPDGYARVAVRYADEAGAIQTGLLAVEAIRTVILENGIFLVIRNVDGEWQTTVQSVAEGSVTSLVEGDVLFRDKTTGTALDGPETLEAVMVRLVAEKVGTAEFSVIRGSSVQTAFMMLAIVSGAEATGGDN